MATSNRKMKIPKFSSEEQEARWWDDHKEQVENNLIAAMREGRAQKATAQHLIARAQGSKNITIRLSLADLERARQLSAKRGLAYQTFIKMLLHEALDSEEKRRIA